MLLEGAKHKDSSFVTLTYDDEHLPPDNSLSPADLRLFIKRLRKWMGTKRLRYYAVGEYGERKSRPHYHMIAFGLSCTPDNEKKVREIWGCGHVMLGTVSHASLSYCASYMVKGASHTDKRHPTFARMSNRPGIGALAIPDIALSIRKSQGVLASISRDGDVPKTIKWGKKSLPLGKYLVRQLRTELNVNEEKAKYLSALKMDYEIEQVLLTAGKEVQGFREIRDALVKATEQKALNLTKRAEIYGRKKRL